jgi:hypothetical protein
VSNKAQSTTSSTKTTTTQITKLGNSHSESKSLNMKCQLTAIHGKGYDEFLKTT